MRNLLDWLSGRYKDLVRAPGLEEVTFTEHEAIFEAIKRRDGNAAADQILHHIKRADERFKKGDGVSAKRS
ncbi:transcriptional regulator NanR [compost metagenome]